MFSSSLLSLLLIPSLLLGMARGENAATIDRRNFFVAGDPGVTHFVHLDRPERGRNRMRQEVQSFLLDTAASAGK